MEYGTIEREIHVDAAPEIVFEVISRPEHLREWWPDDAAVEPTPGAVGELIWGDKADNAMAVPITILDVEPPRRFSFRWVHPRDEAASQHNSLFVTFELVPAGAGTRVRLTETGFREQGWEAAVLEQQYQEHVEGWDMFLPRLRDYVARLVESP